MGNRFSDGFILGAVVGAAAFFLLGTEKGKKVLKVVTEEGGEELGKFLKEFEQQRAGVKPEPSQPFESPADQKTSVDPSEDTPSSNGAKTKPRKFFKKSN